MYLLSLMSFKVYFFTLQQYVDDKQTKFEMEQQKLSQALAVAQKKLNEEKSKWHRIYSRWNVVLMLGHRLRCWPNVDSIIWYVCGTVEAVAYI